MPAIVLPAAAAASLLAAAAFAQPILPPGQTPPGAPLPAGPPGLLDPFDGHPYLLEGQAAAPPEGLARTAAGAEVSARVPDGFAAAPTVIVPPLTVETVTNGPVPDTRENRRRFGGPDSRAGRATAPAGN